MSWRTNQVKDLINEGLKRLPNQGDVLNEFQKAVVVKPSDLAHLSDELTHQSARFYQIEGTFLKGLVDEGPYNRTLAQIRHALTEMAKEYSIINKLKALLDTNQILPAIDFFKDAIEKPMINIKESNIIIQHINALARNIASRSDDVVAMKQVEWLGFLKQDMMGIITKYSAAVIALPLLAFGAWAMSKINNTQQA